MSRDRRRWLGAAALFAIMIGVAARVLWLDAESAMDCPITQESPVIFELERGATIKTVASSFATRGWIKRAAYLEFEARWQRQATRVQAGAYEILPGETPRQLLQKFVEGRVKLYEVTFAEGIRAQDLLARLGELPGLKRELAGVPPASLMAALKLEEGAPEGWFFPSTYFYRHNSSDRDLLMRSHRQLQELLDKEWAVRDARLPYKDPVEALIMASIIERESAIASERPLIAGVFVRRLRQGMRLQTDPTVIYGLGSSFDGNLRRADLERDTPYNTYTRAGLPPTPICLPGAEAIRAALHPADGDALYFVARGDGSHVFSATLSAHTAAVREFQTGGHK